MTLTLCQRRAARVFASATSVLSLTLAPLSAQTSAPSTQQPLAPTLASAPAPTWSIYGDWLQGADLPFDRDAMPSAAFALQRQSEHVTFDIGYLRAAQEFSTVQGGFGAVGWAFRLGPVTFVPAVGVLLGKASASADTTGYHYSKGGVVGYQSRYSFSTGFAVGGGAQATVLIPMGSMVQARLSVAEWMFSADPLADDNKRLLAGAGLAINFPRRSATGGK